MSTNPVQVQVERDARVMTVRLVNPPHNFMNRAMVEDLIDLVGELESDEGIGAVIVIGGVEGKFITHYDVAEIHEGSEGLAQQVGPRVAGMTLAATSGLSRLPRAGDALRRTPVAGVLELREIHDLFLRMNRMDKVFVAAIGGPAMGGGCELALACDLRVMAKGTGQIGLPEVSLGIEPGAGGSQRMAHAVGSARALELILEAQGLEAEEALEAGLVNRVVDPADLETAARELAERMARRSPASIAGVKHSIYFGASSPLPAGLSEERRWFLAAASTPQARRALGLYAEQVEATGVPPWADEELRSSWQAGTATDVTEER